jgi:hypothetical protein
LELNQIRNKDTCVNLVEEEVLFKMNEKLGIWTKDPDITKNWTKADYMINNREIIIHPGGTFPLKTLRSIKNASILMVLYGLCDLTFENPEKNYFNMDEIKRIIDLRIKKYKLYLQTKAFYLIERINRANFNKTTLNYNVDAIISREKLKYTQFSTNKIKLNVKMDNVYYALALLSGNLVNIKAYTKKGDYSEIYDESKNKTHILYYLSSSGKDLMRKYRELGKFI